MILHPIRKLLGAGIRDICVVTGAEHAGAMLQLLGSGADFECEFTYRVQDRPGGVAEALGLVNNFAHGEMICTILGDNILQDDLGPYVENFRRQGKGARILLKAVPDPHHFGVVELEDGRVIHIEEKPSRPRSNLAMTGIFMYDETVFDIIRSLKPSARGELEMADVNNTYVMRGELQYDVLHGWWIDAGTFETMQRANELVIGIEAGHLLTASPKIAS